MVMVEGDDVVMKVTEGEVVVVNVMEGEVVMNVWKHIDVGHGQSDEIEEVERSFS